MNPWNRLYLFHAWLVVACALGGRYLAHDTNIASAALIFVAVLLTATVHGADRAERKWDWESRSEGSYHLGGKR